MKGLWVAIAATLALGAGAQETRGYYKDVFMDGGIFLTSRKDLPAARLLHLQMEQFISSPHPHINATDTIMQTQMLAGSDIDENGILLYPDGQPRFRMVYVNGGRATKHGGSLGEKARDNFRKFVDGGGSYLGTCAGQFLAGRGTMNGDKEDTLKIVREYLSVWPGLARSLGLSKHSTGMFIEPQSPLLRYYDFGGDMRVDSVWHNGGGYAYEIPQGTEILARYDTDTIKMKRYVHRQPSIWAYKADQQSGRVVCCGSHPEGVADGERLQLMAAMMRYALDGNGTVTVKGALADGAARNMTKRTSDNDPDFTMIGDKQYHHFTVDVPDGTSRVEVELKSVGTLKNFDLYLFADDKEFAFSDNARWQNVALGIDKTLVVDNPPAGRLHVSVYCATTVDTQMTAYGTQYTGRVDVLNGVPYVITATCKQLK